MSAPFASLLSARETVTSIGDALPALAIGLAILVCLAVIAWLSTQQLARLKEVSERLAALERLEAIEGQVRGLADHQDGLDLRRLEHVVVDMRDAQKRLEERLVGLVEAQQRLRDDAPAVSAPATLTERILTRLLALGYERVEVLTALEELDALGDGDGDVLVEARKGGALHKGRVVVRGGAIAEVRLRSAYEAFP